MNDHYNEKHVNFRIKSSFFTQNMHSTCHLLITQCMCPTYYLLISQGLSLICDFLISQCACSTYHSLFTPTRYESNILLVENVNMLNCYTNIFIWKQNFSGLSLGDKMSTGYNQDIRNWARGAYSTSRRRGQLQTQERIILISWEKSRRHTKVMFNLKYLYR